MPKINSFDDLNKLRDEYKKQFYVGNDRIQVKIAKATCGIAAGANDVEKSMIEALKDVNIDNVDIIQTGCMGYCFAEPTVEVIKPETGSIIFGYVDSVKAREIVNKYIKNNEVIDGVLPEKFKSAISNK